MFFLKLDLQELFQKHAELSQLLISLAPEELILASPSDPRRRGGFVAFRHRHAEALVEELHARRVVASVRKPNIVRFGLSALYHREADVRELARRLYAMLD